MARGAVAWIAALMLLAPHRGEDAVGDYTTRVVVYGEAEEGCGVLNVSATCRRVNLTGVLFEPALRRSGDLAALVIHGGGFLYGDACDCFSQGMGAWFASRGVAALSIDYRLEGDRGLAPVSGVFTEDYANAWGGAWRVVPTDMFSAIRDARAAVRYLRAALGFGRVVAAGHSAGACAALALAALSGSAAAEGVYRDEVDDPARATTRTGETSAVDGAVPFAATVDGVAALRPDSAGFGSWTLGAKPPLLLVHGLADGVNRPENSAWVLNASGYAGPAAAYFVPAEGHSLHKPQFDDARTRLAAWLEDELGVSVAESAAVGRDAGAAACPSVASLAGHHGYWDCPKKAPTDVGGAFWTWLVAVAALSLAVAVAAALACRRANRAARRRRAADDAEEAGALADATADDAATGLELINRASVAHV